jgi:2'-5' RNA ligase
MNHFLGFFVNDESRKQIVNSLDRVSSIFSDMGIEVRWIKPSDYHIKLQNLPGNVGLLKKQYISYKMKDILKKPIQISIGDVKLGSSRNLRGLLYFEIEQGGDALREFRYELLKTLKIKDNVQFIPHIAVGRINKDLSRPERSNILRDMENVSTRPVNGEAKCKINQIELVKVEEGNYEVLKKFTASS